MRLTGIELRNFRSVGETGVILRPWRKCNILVGKNNSGKSNVIKAMQIISTLCEKKDNNITRPTIGDRYRRTADIPFLARLEFELDEENLEDQKLKKIANFDQFYFDLSWEFEGGAKAKNNTFTEIKEFQRANNTLKHLTGNHWTTPVSSEHIKTEFLNRGWGIFRGNFSSLIPKAQNIPVFRQIKQGDDYEYDGTSLIARLASYQHPKEGEDSNREKFDKIENFTRNLLHMPQAVLEVDHDKEMILITNDGLRLPLEDYGTGVHELVILVTAVLSIENSICCIEEPEIHLHPTLQREFIKFIATETSNQYLISTHSSTLINAHTTFPPDISNQVQVFHLFLENGSTVGRPVLEDAHSLIALNDLGSKASDILQANCIIWVEGPSDRVYLNHWLKLLDSNLIEGLHYSIMFYGSWPLLPHLNLSRNQVPEELVEVLKINQHSIVIIDSDKKNSRTPISPTKKRILSECDSNGSSCWITDGREIENYIPASVLEKVCLARFGKPIKILRTPYDQIEDALSSALKAANLRGFDYSRKKVEYAREFIKYFDLTDMDKQLKKRVETLITQIKTWNA